MSSISELSSKPLVYLTRIESFSASHRLHNPLIDGQKNKEIYGKCNTSHGHNYKVEVTVKGIVDVMTGMVLDIAVLKNIINETVMKSLDHKDIDKDVEYFSQNNIVSSAENIAVFIWKIIQQKLPNSAKLHSIKLHETDKNVVEYKGELL